MLTRDPTGEALRFLPVNWRNKWRNVYQNYYEPILLTIVWIASIGTRNLRGIVIPKIIFKIGNQDYKEKVMMKYIKEMNIFLPSC